MSLYQLFNIIVIKLVGISVAVNLYNGYEH